MKKLLLFLSILFITSQVFGATETLYPSAAGDLTQLSNTSGTNWQDVDETPSDDDTSYVWKNTTSMSNQTGRDLYNIPTPSVITASDTITSVVIYINSRWSSNNGTVVASTVIKENATQTDGADNTVTNTYTTYSTTYTTKPSDGTAWTLADFTDLQIGVKHIVSGLLIGNPSQVRTTQVWVEINYVSFTPRVIVF